MISLDNITPLTQVKVLKGYYENEIGTFNDCNDTFIFINIRGSTVLFLVSEYLEYIEVV